VPNISLLLALNSTDPPIEYEPRNALLAANYSVPILWLSLFNTDGLVNWPSTLDDSTTYTAIIQPVNECIERSRNRLADWSRRWPDVFAGISSTWLGFAGAIEAAHFGVWTEDISEMSGDEIWTVNLRAYLNSLDDPSSIHFHEALAQSYLSADEADHGRLSPTIDSPVALLVAGYTWARQPPWDATGEAAAHPYGAT
jgi:hypothetical protein